MVVAVGDIGRKFRLVRERHHPRLSQSDVARKLQISFARLNHYEHGRHDPPSDIVAEFAKIFDVPIQWFYNDTSESPQPGFNPPAPFADRESHPKVGRRQFQVMGVVGAAEFPIDPGSEEDFVEFSDDLYTESPTRFAIRVRGDSMRAFREDDYVLVHPLESFRTPGFYVVAQSPEFGYCLKLLCRDSEGYYLQPETEGYPDIRINGDGWRIVGPVVGHRRERFRTGRGGIQKVRSYTEVGDNDGLTPGHYT